MTKENICSYHGDIKLLAKKIKQLTLRKRINKNGGVIEYDCESNETIDKIHKCASEIYEIVKKAKIAGQHMENRLQVYRDGIEAMGFIRKRKNGKNKIIGDID